MVLGMYRKQYVQRTIFQRYVNSEGERTNIVVNKATDNNHVQFISKINTVVVLAFDFQLSKLLFGTLQFGLDSKLLKMISPGPRG